MAKYQTAKFIEGIIFQRCFIGIFESLVKFVQMKAGIGSGLRLVGRLARLFGLLLLEGAAQKIDGLLGSFPLIGMDMVNKVVWGEFGRCFMGSRKNGRGHAYALMRIKESTHYFAIGQK